MDLDISKLPPPIIASTVTATPIKFPMRKSMDQAPQVLASHTNEHR
jgi:hypothetical protein